MASDSQLPPDHDDDSGPPTVPIGAFVAFLFQVGAITLLACVAYMAFG